MPSDQPDDRLSVSSPEVAFAVVAIAASAGGVKVLSFLLSRLPADFAAAIAVVLHTSPHTPNLMPQILHRQTALVVKEAVADEAVCAGVVYMAPPDWHLLIQRNHTITLSHTQKINYARPAADILFESVAAAYGRQAIGVVLSGRGQDGANGIAAIKHQGGCAIAQDPTTAEFAGMPQAAIDTHLVDWVMPLEQIPPLLMRLVCGKS